MKKFEKLRSDIKNTSWNISIPDGIEDYTFELKILGDVGAGNAFDLEITDTNSNILWRELDNNGNVVSEQYTKALTNIPNYGSLFVKGKFTKIPRQYTCFFMLEIYHMYGTYTKISKVVGTSYGDGLKTLKVRTPNSQTNISGIIKLDSTFKISPNIIVDKNTIGLVGDSITDQYQREFDYFNEKKSLNLGFPGQTISSIRSRVQNFGYTDEDNLSIMINMSGTNDIPYDESNMDYEKFKNDYISLCSTLKSFGTLININVLYVDDEQVNGDPTGEKNRIVKKCNDIISEINVSKGYISIDMNKHMSTNGVLKTEFSIDGLHLNEAGITYFNRKLREELDKLGV